MSNRIMHMVTRIGQCYLLVMVTENGIDRSDNLSKFNLLFQWVVPVIEPACPFAFLHDVVGGTTPHFPPPVTAIVAQPVAFQSCQDPPLSVNLAMSHIWFICVPICIPVFASIGVVRPSKYYYVNLLLIFLSYMVRSKLISSAVLNTWLVYSAGLLYSIHDLIKKCIMWLIPVTWIVVWFDRVM